MDTAKQALRLVEQHLEDPDGHDDRVRQALAQHEAEELVRILGIVGSTLLIGNAQHAGRSPAKIVQKMAIQINRMEADRDRPN